MVSSKEVCPTAGFLTSFLAAMLFSLLLRASPPPKKKHTEKLCQEKKKSFFPILLCLFALHSDSHKPITLPTCSAACAVGAECSQAGPTTPWSILLSSPVTRQVASMEDTKQHTENEAVIWNPGFLPSLAKLQETSRAFVSLQ